MSATDSITVTQAINKVTVTAQGSVGLNAGGQIDGNLELIGNLTVGQNGAGKDVRFYGATSSKYIHWDASQDKLIVTGSAQFDGDTTFVNSTVTVISDPVLSLGGNSVPTSSDSKDRGIEHFYWDATAGSGKRGFFGWSNADNAYKFLTDCPDPSGAEIFTGTAANLKVGEAILTDGVFGSTHRIQATGNNFFFHSGHGVFQYSCGVRGNRGSAVGMESNGIDSYLALCAGGSEKVRIATDGKLGIGVTSASGELHVKNVADLYTSLAGADSALNFADSAGDTWRIGVRASDNSFRLCQDATSLGTNARLTIADGGNVGIGTHLPAGELEVQGTGDLLYLRETGREAATITGQGNGSGSQMIFKTHSGSALSEAMRILPSGNVGIGVAAPTAQTDIRGANSVVHGRGQLYLSNTESAAINQGSQISLGGTYDGTNDTFFASVAGRKENATAGDYDGYLQFSTRTNGGNNVERMRIDSNGNVAIGTSYPSGNALKTTFHINGTAQGAAIRLSHGSNSSLLRYDDTDGLQIGTIASKPLTFETGDTAAVTIDTSQNVGIGTTANPTSLLHVEGATPTVTINGTSSAGPTVQLSGTYTNWTIENQYAGGANNDMFRIRNSALSADALVINRGNNYVGINNSNPTKALDVDGGIRWTGNSSALGNITFNDNVRALFGNSTDLQIYHSGHNRILAYNGDLRFSTNGTERLRIEDTTGLVRVFGDLQVDGSTVTVNSTTVTIDDPVLTLGGDTAPSTDDNKDRGIEFRYYDGSAKMGFMGWDDSAGGFTFLKEATNSSEVFSGTAASLTTGAITAGGTIRSEATGGSVFTDLKSDQIFSSGAFDLVVGTNNKLHFRTDDTRRMTIAGDGKVGIGTDLPARNVSIYQADSSLAYLQFANSTTTSAASNGLEIGINGDEEAVFFNRENTDMVFRTNNTEFLRFDAGEDQTKASKHIRFNDDIQARFGTGTDATIRYTGSDWFIQCNLGDAYFQNLESGKDIILKANSGSGAEEYLKLDGGLSKTVFSKPSVWLDNQTVQLGNAADLQISHNGNHSNISNATGNLQLINNANNQDIRLICDDGSGGTATYLTIDGGREEVVANKPFVQTPGTDDPANNGELAFTVVSNTSIKIKYKGTDGTVRSTSLTLS